MYFKSDEFKDRKLNLKQIKATGKLFIFVLFFILTTTNASGFPGDWYYRYGGTGGSYTESEQIYSGIAVEGDYAYLINIDSANIRQSFVVLDIHDPENPTFAGECELTKEYTYSDIIKIKGNRAYLTSNICPMIVIDINDPNNPEIITYEETSQFEYGISSYDIEIVDNFAYVGTNLGLLVYDISTLDPQLVGEYEDTEEEVVSVCVVENYVLLGIGSGASGILVLDITTRSEPKYVDKYYIEEKVEYIGIGGTERIEVEVTDVEVVGNYVFYATSSHRDNSFFVLELSDMGELSPVDGEEEGDNNYMRPIDDIVIDGTRAYLRSSGVVEYIDISDPLNIILIGGIDSGANGIASENGFIYLIFSDRHFYVGQMVPISRIIVEPRDLYTGESSVITVYDELDDLNEFVNKDVDILGYSYETTGGSIIGSGNQVTWVAPDVPGEYHIYVTMYTTEETGTSRCTVTAYEKPNFVPVIENIEVLPTEIPQGGTSIIKVTAYDADEDEITYSYESSGGFINGEGAIITWTADVPAPGAPPIVGTFFVDVTVSDGKSTDTERIYIDVTGEETSNHAPIIQSIDVSPSQITQGESTTISVEVFDYEGDSLIYSYESSGGFISGSGSVVTWTADLPASGAPPITGTFFVDVTVSDGKESDTSRVYINVEEPEVDPIEIVSAVWEDEEDEMVVPYDQVKLDFTFKNNLPDTIHNVKFSFQSNDEVVSVEDNEVIYEGNVLPGQEFSVTNWINVAGVENDDIYKGVICANQKIELTNSIKIKISYDTDTDSGVDGKELDVSPFTKPESENGEVLSIQYPNFYTEPYKRYQDEDLTYYKEGDTDFSHISNPLVRKYALIAASTNPETHLIDAFPDDPGKVSFNVFRFVDDNLESDISKGIRQNDVWILSELENGALDTHSPWVCITHAYLFTSFERALGFPSRELTVAEGYPSIGSITVYLQNGAAEIWHSDKWNFYDPWTSGTLRNGAYVAYLDLENYLDDDHNDLTMIKYRAWYAFDKQTAVTFKEREYKGHKFEICKVYVPLVCELGCSDGAGSPVEPYGFQWKFLKEDSGRRRTIIIAGSPIKMLLKDSQGRLVGSTDTGIVNEIIGAKYMPPGQIGYSDRGDPDTLFELDEFISLPDDFKGDYELIIKGTEDGEYLLQFCKFDPSLVDEYSEVTTLRSTIKKDEVHEYKVSIDESSIKPEIPLSPVFNLQSANGTTWINWTWTNPNDPDFNHTEIYLNGTFKTNTSAEYFNATGLQPETSYTIGTCTADIYGNVNETWVNLTATTKKAPIIVDAGTDQTVEEGTSVNFEGNYTASGSHTYSTNWEFGDGLIVEGTVVDGSFVTSHVYEDDGVYTVNLTVTDEEGDSGNDTLLVSVMNVVPVPDAGSDLEVFEVDLIQFTGNFTDPGANDSHTIEWDFGDGLTSSGDLNSSHTYVDNGLYIVTLNVTDDDGGTGTDILNVTVMNAVPVVNAGSDLEVFEGDLIQFTGNFTDPGVLDNHTIVWDFGDGSTIAGDLNTSHNYADDGVYTVILNVTDDDGGVGTDNLTVKVRNVSPQVKAGADISVVEGSRASFSGSFTDPGVLDTHTIVWDFGDGSTITGDLNTSHTYADDGVYTVILNVTDDDGGTGIDTLNVTVLNAVPVVTAGPDLEVTAGDPVSYAGNFSDAGWLDKHTAEWNFGEGTVETGSLTEENRNPESGGTVSGNFTYFEPGVFNVILKVLDDDGGIGQDQLTVTVLPIVATVDFDPDTLNLGSGGKWVTAYIELPDGYDVAGIDASSMFLFSIFLNDETVSAVTDPKYGFVKDESEYLMDRDGDGILERMLKFDREEVEAILETGDEVIVTFKGKVGYENEVASGMASFEGTDTIKVIESLNTRKNNEKNK